MIIEMTSKAFRNTMVAGIILIPATMGYDPMKRTGVAVTKIEASKTISIGAYNFALAQIDK